MFRKKEARALQVPMNGAQRASGNRTMRLVALSIFALVVGFGGLAANPAPTTAATSVKVVIVVGPVEGSTAKYVRDAKSYADLARSLGAKVTEVYSPNATWTKVKAAAKGANILIYLGHGNGYPSPYGPFAATRRNGMGLNSSAGHGNSNVKYYGQTQVKGLALAKNSVVLLNHLCYASGDSEPGRANPSKATAMKRADGYGTGFLRSGAKAVFASGNGSLGPIITDLLTSDKRMSQIFKDDRSFTGTRDFSFASKHTPGATVWMDPYAKSRYYHSVNGKLTLTATQVRAG
jgi:hypothetical protein